MLHLQGMKPIWGHKAVKWVFSHLSYAVLILADWKFLYIRQKKILAFNNQMLTQVYLCFSSSKKVYDLIPSHHFFCLHSHFMCSEWHTAPTCLHLLRLRTPPHPNTQTEKMFIKRHKLRQVRLSCLTVSTVVKVMQEVNPCVFKGWVYPFGLKMINCLFLGELWSLCKNLHKTKLNDSSYCNNKCLKASAFILTRRVDSPSLLTFLYRSATLL